MKLPLEGECLCSATRFRINGEPLFTHACHCLNCQRASGSAFSLSTMALESDLEVTSGEATIHPKSKDLEVKAFICPSCWAVLWFRRDAASPRVLVVRSGVLNNKSEIRPQAHIFVHRKQDWVVLEDGVPTFEGDYERSQTWPAASLARLST